MRKTILLAVCLQIGAFVTFARAARMFTPTQAQLDAALEEARVEWGANADIRAIRLVRLNECRVPIEGWARRPKPGQLDRAAESDFMTREIRVNQACWWTEPSLHNAVLHEYGHLLLGTVAHSLDRRSVMYLSMHIGGGRRKIGRADREWLREMQVRERPTIMLAPNVRTAAR